MTNESCIAAGYLLAMPIVPPAYVTPDRLPNRLVTASSCLTDIIPDVWLMPWGRASEKKCRAEMARLGLDPNSISEMKSELADLAEAGTYIHPVFTSVDEAASFRARFLSALTIQIVGLGLPAQFVAGEFNDWTNQAAGTFACLRRGERLAPGGTILGYEPLGEDWPGTFHSWHCCNAEPEVHSRLGIELNPFGLIADEQLAIEAARLVESEGLCEPCRWLPWLLVAY